MKKEELEAIRKRVDAATPGPWFNSKSYIIKNIKSDSIEWTADFIAEADNEKDAQFIAHAREDIPKLLEYIDELKAKIERYEKALKGIKNDIETDYT